MAGTCKANSVLGVTPGLGFVHLSAEPQLGSGASVSSGRTSTGGRGVPHGEPAADSDTCCNLCEARDGCAAWLHRGARCFLGRCDTALPCFERLRSAQQPPLQATAGARSQGQSAVRLCGRPTVAQAPQLPGPSSAHGRRATVSVAASRAGARAAHGLALLMLGHRSRLMLETVPPNVIAPTVTAGTPVDVFAYLENTTMARAFRGRRPLGHPALAALSDSALAERIASAVEAAGARTAVLRIAPRPTVTLPTAFPQRLSRYTEHVKTTVATRFAKELLGWRLVEGYERERAAGRYAWVLWMREDAHWFAPLDLARFERGAVHGKACGGFGGWNDKVWLMDREWAPTMLSMHDAFRTAYPASCTDLTRNTSDGPEAGDSDFLAAPSVEQFRERVGKLHRIPFSKHAPEDLPTMDSYYKDDGKGEWALCFPRIYANGCVPRVNASAVGQMSCA